MPADIEKKSMISELREAVKDCKLPDPSDEYLSKWLEAKNLDLQDAEKMLRKSLEWRKLNDVDGILKTFERPKVLKKYFSMGRVGHDKLGCPVYVSVQGRMDIKGIMQSVSRSDYMRHHIWLNEKNIRYMRKESQKSGKNMFSITAIVDMEGFSMKQLTYKPALDTSIEQSKIFDANYPGRMRRTFIINAPKLFMVSYNMLKRFAHPNNVANTLVFGSNKEEWKAALLEEIDADQLPVIYGGTLTDPDGDPKCPSKFNMGGEVPRKYYLSQTAPEPKDYMENLTVMAGGTKKLKFNVDLPNSVLRWEFLTENGDIIYRIYHKNDEGVVEEMVSKNRVDSHLYIEEGQIVCYSSGKYVVDFDNSFSYVKSKKVHYSVTIEPPMEI